MRISERKFWRSRARPCSCESRKMPNKGAGAALSTLTWSGFNPYRRSCGRKRKQGKVRKGNRFRRKWVQKPAMRMILPLGPRVEGRESPRHSRRNNLDERRLGNGGPASPSFPLKLIEYRRGPPHEGRAIFSFVQTRRQRRREKKSRGRPSKKPQARAAPTRPRGVAEGHGLGHLGWLMFGALPGKSIRKQRRPAIPRRLFTKFDHSLQQGKAARKSWGFNAVATMRLAQATLTRAWTFRRRGSVGGL